jgi:hypothetical protein
MGGSELEKIAPPAATRQTTVLCAEVGTPQQPASRYLEVLAQAAELSGGRVLHTHANGVLALFSTPDAAAAAAARMHVYAQALPPEQAKLEVRIGFHAGPVGQRNDDIFGDTVNLALQLADQARGGQILTSHDTASGLAPALQGLVRPIRHMRVQGKKGELLLGELVWKDAVGQIVSARSASGARAVLRVTFRGKALFRRREGDTMALGRDPQCDLNVDDAAVSRQHCTIARKGAVFILRDHSSNGTFVTAAGQGEVRIHEQELALDKSGILALGQSAAAAEHTVSYLTELHK